MKALPRSIIYLLNFSLCIQLVLPFPASSQGREEDGGLSLNFAIFGAKKVCMGEPIILEARLTNNGNRSAQVDVSSIWRNVTEIAYDRSSTNSTLGGIPLHIPQTRATTADIGFQIGPSNSTFTLGKGATYSSFLVLNRRSDDFYNSPGKYAVRSLYSPSISPEPGSRVETVSDHVFQLVKCE